jgi:hypothetical protein
MPRQTKETALPKAPAAPIDWARMKTSGRVWEFVEGEDFTGRAESFRSRKKTEARKEGFDFDSVEIRRSGKTVLKVLVRPAGDKPAREPRANAAASSASEVDEAPQLSAV